MNKNEKNLLNEVMSGYLDEHEGDEGPDKQRVDAINKRWNNLLDKMHVCKD